MARTKTPAKGHWLPDVDPMILAKSFLDDGYFHYEGERLGEHTAYYTLRRWREKWFLWKDGSYHSLSDDTVEVNLTSYLQEEKSRMAARQKIELNINKTLIGNVLVNLKPLVHIRESHELGSWLDGKDRGTTLSLQNGLLFLNEGDADGRLALKKHSPEYFTTVCLPYPYDPKADCPTWKKFLADTLGGDAGYVRLVQQFAGYLLMPSLKYRKFLLGLGEGGTGKGTLVSTLCAMLGKENISGVPLHQFGQRFGLIPTLGKAVNWCDETVHYIDPIAEETLKAFVAGTSITFDRKNRDAISTTPTAKVVITSNSEPRWNDKSMGTWDRVLLVPFEHRVEEADRIPDLGDKLKQELPGILNWALAGMADLERNKGFVQPCRNTELLTQYRRDCDPARTFLEENYTTSPNAHGRLPKQAVYDAYRKFCSRIGCKPLNEVHFSKVVFKVFPGCTSGRKRLGGVENKRVQVYEGLVAANEDGVPKSREDWR